MNDAQLDRYARHIVLREVGGEGQRRLLSAKVAVVGAGGLGSPMLTYLAAAGVGNISIIDDDAVSLSNLQRQTLFGTADVGRHKVDVARERLAALNPDVRIATRATRLGQANARAMLAGHDVIADGCDNFATRRAVSDAAVALGIPLVAAAIGPFEGQLGVFAGHLGDAACWRCFAGDAAEREGGTCADEGVLGALAGVVGAMAALEVMRLILGFGEPQLGKLLLYDALGQRQRTLRVPRDPACPAHGGVA
ncbi:HesA/MoeB/ThiF family protein [Sandaracinobacteroides saxicola]|uniref:HesA/MoeB/ThiF family protein n=1 Tax=Sandaracinobacteroides saxicola TaxID=2759707 RepID=A0A7G5IH66_9SPHN|nr:HesA/MoeB/ThiF family protein [Sandaracinobacteroides saxicola]QMW22708.1 HesA/MoeB/ThiF family protein [Sandaracinobacteroides saxicola]